MKEIGITHQEEGITVLKIASKILPDAPRSLIYKFIRNKNIEVNGARCKSGDVLKAGDKVLFFLSDETYDKLGGRRMITDGAGSDTSGRQDEAFFRSRIIYEDDDYLFFDKPAYLRSQRDASGRLSLNDMLLKHCGVSGPVKPSICNRLDVNTSGIVLCGRSQKGLDRLNNAIKEHRIRKFYRALLFGRIDNDLHLTAYISQSDKDNKVSISDRYPGKNDGYRECITDIRVIEATDDITYAEIQLVTGRKHQIRAHTAHIGHPVIGDIKYGDKKSRVISAKRQMLHASRVELPDDILDGMTICSAIPQDIKELLLRYGFKETS
ncbi:MAG: RluA family pseudouridine synthase [Lachnospiraceae bacterium]|nr:RluA family pseudouridine synthase [Lachnospiraceae bacterium]